jgi:hypothetical protein
MNNVNCTAIDRSYVAGAMRCAYCTLRLAVMVVG